MQEEEANIFVNEKVRNKKKYRDFRIALLLTDRLCCIVVKEIKIFFNLAYIIQYCYG